MTALPEIVAPAGDLEKLRFAVLYGADAVYLGGYEFGMRSAAGNFSEDELRHGILFAHGRGVKAYVTLNTMPRNEEIERLPAFIELLSRLGADAVVLSDIGVLSLVKKHAPGIAIHISTQASVVNFVSARRYFDEGASRIILARELHIGEIETIRAKTPPELELEAFVHGAMCVSYSGRCLISNYMTGRDANRGACAQPCRWAYRLVEEKRPGEYMPVLEEENGTYFFNSKDMCLIDRLPQLSRAGVTSFKIEGRIKTSYYTAAMSNAYKRAVRFYAQYPDAALPDEIRDEVFKVSHRHYCTGFYFGDGGAHQYYPSSEYIREWDVAAVVEECGSDGLARLKQKNRFFANEELELLEPGKNSVRFNSGRITDADGAEIACAPHPHMTVYMRLPHKAQEMAIVRRKKPEIDNRE